MPSVGVWLCSAWHHATRLCSLVPHLVGATRIVVGASTGGIVSSMPDLAAPTLCRPSPNRRRYADQCCVHSSAHLECTLQHRHRSGARYRSAWHRPSRLWPLALRLVCATHASVLCIIAVGRRLTPFGLAPCHTPPRSASMPRVRGPTPFCSAPYHTPLLVGAPPGRRYTHRDWRHTHCGWCISGRRRPR